MVFNDLETNHRGGDTRCLEAIQGEGGESMGHEDTRAHIEREAKSGNRLQCFPVLLENPNGLGEDPFINLSHEADALHGGDNVESGENGTILAHHPEERLR